MKRTWREAATLIVVARDLTKNINFDYKVLTFTRTEKTSFMPNSVCFAGGAVDKTDESSDWLTYLHDNKISLHNFQPNAGSRRPMIFNSQDKSIKREISLRLTAIRETFEELGIVFCRKPDDSDHCSSFYHSKALDIPEWQKKIHDGEESLLSFCEKFKLVPDLANVHEWSCWMTPTYFRPKRFETAFFLVALNNIPPVYPEKHEVQSFQWETPDEILRLYKEKKLWLPPPQFAEMRRLCNIKTIDELVSLAKSRNNADMEQMMPMQYKVKDGFLHVLPGDDLYHEHPNFYDESGHDIEQYNDKTIDEMRMTAKNLWRSEQRDMFDVKLVINIKPRDGHAPIVSDPISKL